MGSAQARGSRIRPGRGSFRVQDAVLFASSSFWTPAGGARLVTYHLRRVGVRTSATRLATATARLLHAVCRGRGAAGRFPVPGGAGGAGDLLAHDSGPLSAAF